MEKASPSESHRIRNWKWMSLSISNYWNSHSTCVCIGCIIYACEVRWTSELNSNFTSPLPLFNLVWTSSSPQYSKADVDYSFFSLASVSSIINVKTGTKYVQENSECGWHRRMIALSSIFLFDEQCEMYWNANHFTPLFWFLFWSFCRLNLEPHLNSLYSTGIIQVFFIFISTFQYSLFSVNIKCYRTKVRVLLLHCGEKELAKIISPCAYNVIQSVQHLCRAAHSEKAYMCHT